jgi:hypothetical protein
MKAALVHGSYQHTKGSKHGCKAATSAGALTDLSDPSSDIGRALNAQGD